MNEKPCKEKNSEREVRYNVNKNNVCLITLSIPSRIIAPPTPPLPPGTETTFNSIKDYLEYLTVGTTYASAYFQFHQGLS